mgnify:FL=1
MRVLTLVCAAVLIPSLAFAVVPDPTLSDTPDCVRIFPNATLTLDGQVIGNNALPLGGDAVRLIFSASCTALWDCDNPPNPPTVYSIISNPDGPYAFAPAAGGCCDVSISASIEADPGAVTLNVYGAVGSADNTGDGQVTLGDFVTFQSHFGTDNECSDLDGSCNVTVSLADFVVFQSMFGTGCP